MPSFLPSTVEALQVTPLSPTKRRRWFRLLAVAVFLLGLFTLYLYGSFDLFADPIGDKLRAIDAARKQWTAQRLTHYRMVVETETEVPCVQDIEVYYERVIWTYQNVCHLPDVTVSSLFDQLSRYAGQIHWGNDHCDSLNVYPVFNPSRGYPVWVDYRQEFVTPATVGGFAYIATHPLGRLNWSVCTLIGFGRAGVYVKSLTEVPQIIF